MKKNSLISFFLVITFLIITSFYSYSIASSVKIVAKIENKIITNIDVENEYLYLTALNPNLLNIEKDKVLEFAKESLFREKIKKLEIEKFFELNQKNQMVRTMIEGIYKNLGFSNETEFELYLKNSNLKLNDVYDKIEIETIWNQLVYEKYFDQVVINKENLKKKILDNPKKQELYYLYEIVFDYKDKNEIEKKYNSIIKSINEIGFEETVIRYSISKTKNNFGLLGWINKNVLSVEIRKELEDLNLGQITKPIVIPNGMLVLKLDDIKIENIEVNIDEELEKFIKYETNNQLNNYSSIYFNKVKNNLLINEY